MCIHLFDTPCVCVCVCVYIYTGIPTVQKLFVLAALIVELNFNLKSQSCADRQ